MYKVRTIKSTKKIHRCFGCSCKIPMLSSAIYISSVFEGDFFAGYYCKTCFNVTNNCDYFDEFAAEGYFEGDIKQLCVDCDKSDCTIGHKIIDSEVE